MTETVAEENALRGTAGKSQPDLVSVLSEGSGMLLLEFETGERRRLDVSPFIERGGAYELLRDGAYLAKARIIDFGMALGWPDGQGVCPEVLFDLSEPLN